VLVNDESVGSVDSGDSVDSANSVDPSNSVDPDVETGVGAEVSEPEPSAVVAAVSEVDDAISFLVEALEALESSPVDAGVVVAD
jgi:hypothetical protein